MSTDILTDAYTDGRTDPFIEMRGRGNVNSGTCGDLMAMNWVVAHRVNNRLNFVFHFSFSQVYKEKALKAKSMMNLGPSGRSAGPTLAAGTCFKAKSLDPVFKESVPLSQLNGFARVRAADERRRFDAKEDKWTA